MELIADYFGWIFDQGLIGAVVMLIITAVAAASAGLIAANVIMWSLVGLSWLAGAVFGVGPYRHRPDTPRRIRRHAKTERLRDLKAQGLSVRQIHEELRRTG